MQLEWSDKNAQLTALKSVPSQTIFTSLEALSLFVLKIRGQNGEEYECNSIKEWNYVKMESGTDGYVFTFTGPENIPGEENLSVALQIGKNKQSNTNKWYESAITVSWVQCIIPEGLSLVNATLLPLSFREFGTKTQAFYPYSSGIVCEPFTDKKNINIRYPSGFGASMSWFALWDKDGKGVYVAAHDETTTFKDLIFSSDTINKKVDIALRYPSENLGQANSRFAPCKIVLTGFQGDWYDAAVLYRDWVKNEAIWYPRESLTIDGRSDTPQWMKELSVWATGSDKDIEKFQNTFGVPIGFHWYSWHQIPFDNDYPHYFPPKANFEARVAELQKNKNIFVMPYINGRLWDSKDNGTQDSLFTKQALPGVVKQENGRPVLEKYGSKESDGQDVYLGVMCPTAKVWHDKQTEIVLRLAKPSDGNFDNKGNYGVNAVYIDQTAAAPPRECFDKTHGHTLEGGDWWVQAYRNLMNNIHAQLSEGVALTTESNADGYADGFDAFLVWQFQHNGQVPAFAAVYGGAIQLFGRGYDSDGSVLSSKMKLAESFVFGEQIGWISTSILNESEKLEYMKKVVSLRHKFREYFYKGEMSRPPLLLGDNPRLTGTWSFTGNPSIVFTDAVRTGAWRIPGQNKAILMFANSSNETLELKLAVNLQELGFEPSRIIVVRHSSDGSTQNIGAFPNDIHFEPEEVFVLEIQ